MTPIEAFSVGKTVIGTAVDGTPEIIKDGVNGLLVETRNAKQLSEKMNTIIANSDYRKKLEQRAKQSYLREFSFEKLAEKYIAYYERL